MKFSPHFIAAKTFIPALSDKPNTSYTIIGGGDIVIPSYGCLNLSNSIVHSLCLVLMAEYKKAKIRVNEVRGHNFVLCPSMMCGFVLWFCVNAVWDHLLC